MTAQEARAPFAKALRAAMRRRGVRTAALAREVGMSISRVSDARQGRTMPVARNVAAIAHALDAPGLVVLAQAALTMTCDECGRSFVRHARKRDTRFCGDACRTRWHNRQEQRREAGERPDRIRSLARQNTHLLKVIATLRADRKEADAAVAAFCHSCEWDGICKTPACEVRELSPLPLAEGLREVAGEGVPVALDVFRRALEQQREIEAEQARRAREAPWGGQAEAPVARVRRASR